MKKPKEAVRKPHGFSLKSLFTGLAGAVVVAYLFYDRIFGLIPGAAAGLYIAYAVEKVFRRSRERKRREWLRLLLISLETSLEAGCSLENALTLAVEDVDRSFGKPSGFQKMTDRIRWQMEMRIPVWQIMEGLGADFQMEEAEEFAQVLKIQQRTGGNLIRTMQSTADKLKAGMELKKEIEASIAEKRLEQRIMTLMPCGILLYLRLVNGAYIEPAYTTAAGVLVMTAALGLNLLGDYLGSRIVDGNQKG